MPNKNNAAPPIPSCHPTQKHFAKGMCKLCYDRNYMALNRERHRLNARNWAKANPDKRKAQVRKFHYGIDDDTFKAIRSAQDGRCKLCNKETSGHVDHDHATGQVRGLLCGNCNRALGLFREDPKTLFRAISYLVLWKSIALSDFYALASEFLRDIRSIFHSKPE